MLHVDRISQPPQSTHECEWHGTLPVTGDKSSLNLVKIFNTPRIPLFAVLLQLYNESRPHCTHFEFRKPTNWYLKEFSISLKHT